MWNTTFLNDHLKSSWPSLYEVFFRHCAHGSRHKKRTKLLVNHACFKSLHRECDNSHEHLPWGVTATGWATALEVESPLQLCKVWALCLRNVALEHGALELPTSIEQDVASSLHLRAKATLGAHPRAWEETQTSHARPCCHPQDFWVPACYPGPASEISQAHVLSPWCTTDPPTKVIPAHCKCLRAPVLQGNTAGLSVDNQRWYVEYGVCWEPTSFVHRAARLSHPAHFLDGVHDALSILFDEMLQQPLHSIALERTDAMRK